MFHKVRDIIRSDGLSGLAHRGIVRAYRRIRRYSPKQSVRYAGVPICYCRRWSDHLVPVTWVHPDELHEDQRGYEVALIEGLTEAVMPEDRVVIVGAGLGVTAVVAALRVGPLGTVECFEASGQYVALAKETVKRNKAVNVSIHHAVITKSISVYGNGSDLGPIMSAAQLPPCNVIQLDCEGAEVDILQEMTIQPRAVIVETHGLFGAPTALVASLLQKRGYIVSDRGPAEPNPSCTKNDIRVLLGINNGVLKRSRRVDADGSGSNWRSASLFR